MIQFKLLNTLFFKVIKQEAVSVDIQDAYDDFVEKVFNLHYYESDRKLVVYTLLYASIELEHSYAASDADTKSVITLKVSVCGIVETSLVSFWGLTTLGTTS